MADYKYPDPKQFAEAVFPNAIEGPEWDEQNSNDSKRHSHHTAILHVIKILGHYNYNGCTLTQNFLGRNAMSHSTFQKEKCCMLYCSRCIKNIGNADTFHCYTIASLKYDKCKSDAAGHAILIVTAIYPHCSQCDTEAKWRRNNKMDNRCGGRGYEVLQFPHDEVVRD